MLPTYKQENMKSKITSEDVNMVKSSTIAFIVDTIGFITVSQCVQSKGLGFLSFDAVCVEGIGFSRGWCEGAGFCVVIDRGEGFQLRNARTRGITIAAKILEKVSHFSPHRGLPPESAFGASLGVAMPMSVENSFSVEKHWLHQRHSL